MSLESEKQFFSQKKEEDKKNKEESKKEIPPEKREKVLRCLKELNEIKKQEIITDEDKKRAEKIVKEMEKILFGYWKKEGKLGEEDVLLDLRVWGRACTPHFSPDGTQVVIGGQKGDMRVISLTEKDEKGKPKVLAEYNAGRWFYAVNFSPDGTQVVIGGDKGGGFMNIISLTEKDEEGKPKVLAEYKTDEDKYVFAVNFSPDGTQVVIGGNRGFVEVISLTKKDNEGKIQPEVLAEYNALGVVKVANFSPEGDKVLIGGYWGMTIISLTEKDEKGKPKVLAEYQVVYKDGDKEKVLDVYDANFSPDGTQVVIAFSDSYKGERDVVKIISLTEKDEEGKPKVLAEYKPKGMCMVANFSPDGTQVVTSSDRYIKIISLIEKDEKGNPKVVAEYKANGFVIGANFSPDGNKIGIGSIVNDLGWVEVIG